jgi:hypothetical protein
MTEATNEPRPGGRKAKPARGNGRATDPEALEKAKQAAHGALEQAWPLFEAAIHETGSAEPASMAVVLRFKPERVTKKKTIPARVEVVGKASLPTERQVFEARDSGGQLVFSTWYDA